MPDRIQRSDGLLSIDRESPQEPEVSSNPRITEEFIFCHKIEREIKGQGNEWNICPVLMFGKNDERPRDGQRCFFFGLDSIK